MADAEDEQGQVVHMFRQQGRFYEHEFPEVEDMVVVQVLKLDDKTGAYVSLLEYDGKEGMINLGELSKKRIRSLLKILRIGSIEVVSVMSVDEEKGYINLSKKRVEPEDAPPKLEEFAKAKAVHGIMQHVSKQNGIEVEDLCSKVSWPLHNEKYGSAFNAFKKLIEEDVPIWDDLDFSQPGTDLTHLADKIKEGVETHMKRRLIASTLRLQAKCEVSCSEYEGIDAVKEALAEGFKASVPECEVNIKLIAHPTFAFSCICRDKDVGVNALNDALEKVRTAILERKGTFVIISVPSIKEPEPKPTGDTDSEDEEKKAKGDSDSDSEVSHMGEINEADLKALEAMKVDGEEEEAKEK
jgi:translation initiation factor 2 subunit 1